MNVSERLILFLFGRQFPSSTLSRFDIGIRSSWGADSFFVQIFVSKSNFSKQFESINFLNIVPLLHGNFRHSHYRSRTNWLELRS